MTKTKLQSVVHDRIIAGKHYELEESHEKKALATVAAKGYRKNGRLTRVIKRKTTNGRTLYSVFVYWGH